MTEAKGSVTAGISLRLIRALMRAGRVRIQLGATSPMVAMMRESCASRAMRESWLLSKGTAIIHITTMAVTTATREPTAESAR